MVKDKLPDKEELCKMAYTMGYKCFEHSYNEWAKTLQNSENPSEIWLNGNEEYPPISDITKEGTHRNSYQKMIWKIEDLCSLEENEGWDNAGIYGIIEDCSNSWESGAYDALTNEDFKPESLPFVEE